MEEKYSVMAWEWDPDRKEYTYHHKGDVDDYDSAVDLFRSIETDADRIQVELWESGEDEDTRLAYTEFYEGKKEEVWS